MDSGNNDACDNNNTAAPNPEEYNIDADMTDDAPDPPTDDASYLDEDANVSDSGNSDYGNGATRSDVEYSLINSIAADIIKNARPTGVCNDDDNDYEASTTGVEVKIQDWEQSLPRLMWNLQTVQMTSEPHEWEVVWKAEELRKRTTTQTQVGPQMITSNMTMLRTTTSKTKNMTTPSAGVSNQSRRKSCTR